MSKHVVLRSLTELADYFPIDELPPETPGDEVDGDASPSTPSIASVEVATVEAPPADLGALAAQLARASAALAGLARQDQEARQAARGLLERYEALGAELGEAERACAQARQVRQEAETLAANAFEERARAAAGEVATIAAQAEVAATRLLEERRIGVEAVAADPALARLLEERRREEERRRAQAAADERARRLGEGLAAVRGALAAGHLQEAQAMLGELAKVHPDSAEVTSLKDSIRQRLQAVKVDAAEEALRGARGVYRHAPAEALALLERLDLEGLPESLSQQLKGVWAAACARVCKERQAAGLLRYLPPPAYGAVIVREQDGEYRVLSALGLSHLRAGSVVDEAFARRAQPLRSGGR